MSRIWRSPTPSGRVRHLEPTLIILSQTVLGEAEGEDLEGKRAVAWVIENRAAQRGWPDDAGAVCLQEMQFSCWNAGSPRIPVMTDPRKHTTEAIWDECFQAALEANFDLRADRTKGANHYLNEALTRKIRGGTLPSWFDAGKVTLRLGDHTFLKL